MDSLNSTKPSRVAGSDRAMTSLLSSGTVTLSQDAASWTTIQAGNPAPTMTTAWRPRPRVTFGQ